MRAATARRSCSTRSPRPTRACAWSSSRATSATRRRSPPGSSTRAATPWRRRSRFALDAISSFSWGPLQMATALGFFFSILAFLALPLVIVARAAGIYVPGVSSILFVVLFLGGIQLITVGIIGEYVGRIYEEVKQRPLYLVRETRNDPAPGDGGESSRPEHIAAPWRHSLTGMGEQPSAAVIGAGVT